MPAAAGGAHSGGRRSPGQHHLAGAAGQHLRQPPEPPVGIDRDQVQLPSDLPSTTPWAVLGLRPAALMVAVGSWTWPPLEMSKGVHVASWDSRLLACPWGDHVGLGQSRRILRSLGLDGAPSMDGLGRCQQAAGDWPGRVALPGPLARWVLRVLAGAQAIGRSVATLTRADVSVTEGPDTQSAQDQGREHQR